MWLSKNFHEKEFFCPCCHRQEMEFAFIMHLQKFRNEYGKPLNISKGGGWRCASYNAAIGGGTWHPKGKAADIPYKDSAELYELIRLAIKVGFTGLGVYDKHIHVDLRPKGFRAWVGVSK